LVLIWVLLDDSVVTIAPGRLGLLLVRGVATDKTVGPGVHWVPALRRRMAVEYPSLELAYRAGDTWPGEEDDDLQRSGPALRCQLGDRTVVTVAHTVRFRLDPDHLRAIHNRFGPEGFWGAVRDESDRAVRAALGNARFGVDDLFGAKREELDREVAQQLSAALAASGFIVTLSMLGDLDLGRAGDVVQATARAHLELEREEAEAATRVARARIDADLGAHIDAATTEAALRYREIDSWRDLAPQRNTGLGLPVVRSLPAEPRPAEPVVEEDTTTADEDDR
jgi:hypothetical protein